MIGNLQATIFHPPVEPFFLQIVIALEPTTRLNNCEGRVQPLVSLRSSQALTICRFEPSSFLPPSMCLSYLSDYLCLRCYIILLKSARGGVNLF